MLTSEAFSHAVLASLPCLVAYLDRDLNYLYVNDAFIRWFGVSREVCLKSSLREIIGDRAAEVLSPYLKAALLGQPQAFEQEVQYKHGDTKLISVQYLPDRGPNGQVNGVIAIVNDITEKHVAQKTAHAQLEAKNLEIQKLLNGVPARISYWDANLRNIAANNQYTERFSKTPEQMRGMHYQEVIGPLFDGAKPHMEKALRGEVASFRVEAPRPDGSTSYVDVTYQPDVDHGRVKGFFTIAVDVTHQHVSESERARLALFLANILENIPSMIFVKDYSDGIKFSLLNKSGQDILGVSENDVLGKNDYDFFPKEQADFFISKDREVFKGGSVLKIEKEVVTTPRGKRYLRTYKVPTFKPDGSPHLLIGISTDITDEVALADERDAANRRIRESGEYLRSILDSIHHGVWGLDLEGRATFINKIAVKNLGYEDESEILGQFIHELVHYKHADGSPYPKKDCPMHDSFDHKSTHQVTDDVLWRKDGTSFPVSYLSAPILAGGRCVGAVVSFEDLTEQKKLEAQLHAERLKSIHNAKLASLGEMSAGIAHEINNPLAIISGTTGLLTKMMSNPVKFEQKIVTIQKNCDRIARIVSGLRKFSRSGTGQPTREIALLQIITEAVLLTESKSRRQNTPVTVDCNTTQSIRCDEIEIEQVLINLINNGIDAVSSFAEKWVKIEAFDEPDWVVVQITDSGPGIPKPIQAKLFEPFFTTKPVGSGTGLGLSISKGILDEHHAKIEVVSDYPHTRFQIRFPRVPAA